MIIPVRDLAAAGTLSRKTWVASEIGLNTGASESPSFKHLCEVTDGFRVQKYPVVFRVSEI
jgi:hypothetical protein